jgi:hypothetical protein
MKKDPSFDESFFMVAQVHSNWNLLCSELVRWLELSRSNNLFVYSTEQH